MGQVRDGLWRGQWGRGGVIGKGEVRDRYWGGTGCLRDYKGF